jgi:hypothetical protein
LCDYKGKEASLALIDHFIGQLDEHVASLISRKDALIATKQDTTHVEELLFSLDPFW